MKILKTLVPSEKGQVLTVDTIKHDGKLWLVPEWHDTRSTGTTRPKRIILLDALPHTKSGAKDRDYLLNAHIPIGILNGQIPPEEATGFVVLDHPDIEIRGGIGLH